MPTERGPLGSDDVSAVFRDLANEHARRREPWLREQTWAKVQLKSGAYEEPGAFDERDEAEPRSWRLWAGLGAAVVAAGALAFVLVPSSPLRYEVRGAQVDAGWIRTRTENARIDFSDGSALTVHPGASLALEVVGPHAARTRLTQGDLDVSVKHRDATDYRFLAGPYEVKVVGTKFHLTWRPESQLFSVAMSEGRVQVKGPNGLARSLSAGESLQLSGLEPSRELAALEPTSKAPNEPQEAVAPDASRALASARPELNAAPRAEHTNSRAWATLVAKGQFGRVVSEAEEIGIERVVRERSLPEIDAAAHAAFYTGRTALAVQAWSGLRERFGGQRAARQAAFFLGRAFEQQGRRAEAVRWLDTYLSEARSDVYTSEALGRKLTLVEKLEGTVAARNVAREYLGRFPRGAYAQAARAVLAED